MHNFTPTDVRVFWIKMFKIWFFLKKKIMQDFASTDVDAYSNNFAYK